MGESTIETVRRQYEALPYPERHPEDEKKRLITGSPSHLNEIIHFVFKGRRPRYCRALVAGGGTGDGAIMLAQQLAWGGAMPPTSRRQDPLGDVTYIDLSKAALNIAKARAAARGLHNIRFIQGSLLDLPSLATGPYDYIDCCGVLHHLADPPAGLQVLTDILAAGGGMGLMLYAPHGRTGVYMVQRALGALGLIGTAAPAEQLPLSRALLADLPAHHWLNRNPYVGDHVRNADAGGGDAGFYDLLLHAQDRAYRVPECLALAEGAGLRVTAFMPPIQYQPRLYLKNSALLQRAAALPWPEQAALAEDLSGAMKTHVFYAVRAADQNAGAIEVGDLSPSMIPHLMGVAASALAASIAKSGQLTVTLEGVRHSFSIPREAAGIVASIDGQQCLSSIYAENQKRRPGKTAVQYDTLFKELYAILHPLNLLLLEQGSENQ